MTAPAIPGAGSDFDARLGGLRSTHEALITRPNEITCTASGVFDRYRFPILTAEHTPLFWRYDLDAVRNPRLLERMGVNSVFNPGAIELDGQFALVARVEGVDRKSFFAVAESPNGIDNWRFRDYPIRLPETGDPDVNVYDMRLTKHEDGWIYGVFCTERSDSRVENDPSAAIARAGIARTRDLADWERLPDLRTPTEQQRNAVLHPELIDGRYAFYTRPQDNFTHAGSGSGIGWGLCDFIERAEVREELILDARGYHTVKETKNGLGPPPLRTPLGWLHLAHGVRATAAGLRYVLYLFLADGDEPWRVTHSPGGHLIAPESGERVGDVSNVVFSNGWIHDESSGRVFLYYASADTRVHVATSSMDRLLDYVVNTPPDPLRSAAAVEQRYALISRNLALGNDGAR